MGRGCGTGVVCQMMSPRTLKLDLKLRGEKMCFFVVFYFFEGDNPIKLNKSLDKFSFVP